MTCYAFAIDEAFAYQKNNDFTKELRKFAVLSDKFPVFELYTLPKCCPSDSVEMGKRAVEYQAAILQGVKNEEPAI